MILPPLHRPDSHRPAARLAGFAALVLASGVAAVGLLGLRFGLWGGGAGHETDAVAWRTPFPSGAAAATSPPSGRGGQPDDAADDGSGGDEDAPDGEAGAGPAVGDRDGLSTEA